jgi:putative endopeptidase
MTKEIEAAMQGEIEQLPWMSAATEAKGLEKLYAIVNKIGAAVLYRDPNQRSTIAPTSTEWL